MGLAGSQTPCDAGVRTLQVLGLGKYAWFKNGKKWPQLRLKFKMNCDHMLTKGAVRQTVWYCMTICEKCSQLISDISNTTDNHSNKL